MKKTFQDVLKDIEDHLIGKELHGISGSAASFFVSEIDYSNSNVVLDVQGKKKTWTFERMEKVWDEMYYHPAANVEVVFGGSGSSRNQVETIYASLAYVEWLYVNSKKCIAYVGEETHPYGELKHMDADKEAYYQKLMNSSDPRNPLLDPDERMQEDFEEIEMLSPEWFRLKAKEYPQVDDDANTLYQKFQEQFAPEKLKALSDDDLLGYIFLGTNYTNLCNALEFDPQYAQFGSIAGGASYKYTLFYSKSEGTWKTSYGDGGQRSISDQEALEIGKIIRDDLVTGAEIIENWDSLTTVNDYNDLWSVLNAAIPQYITKMWFLKYYHMIFPNLLPNFYSLSWHRHILCSLNIIPSDVQFLRMGQINCFVIECGISNIMFSHIIQDAIGTPKTFFRIGTGDNGAYFDEWYKENYVAIGWNELGDLSAIYQDESDSKTIIIDALRNQWNMDSRLASRKYGEITNFYSAVTDDTYVVAMNGQRILAIGVLTGGYYYDEDREYSHCRPVKWIKVFSERKKLPNEKEGLRTTFCELKDSENLCYLYSLLYGKDDESTNEQGKDIETPEKSVPIRFATGYSSTFPHNRILFGAPGTGKSYTLNVEKDTLLSEGGECERVTFHPDYSYANFVGTYKPVPCKDSRGEDAITYKYVPGPFMRVYTKALENSRTNDIKPFLLVIEEINRANVASVFGDVFQLLDRDDDGVSEYPIQASEDVKKYLVDTLNVDPDECEEIRIPDNMFIWATMNSADQGVFPMDTAFKRRWDFTYLGIDDNDEKIRGKYVYLAADKSQKVEWNKLRKAINHFLAKEKINEDKQLGPYFISRSLVAPDDGDEIDRDKFIRTFKNKVIMYLFEDAAKQKRSKLFEGCSQNNSRYSEICSEFDRIGIGIFNQEIQDEADPEQVTERAEEAE